MSLRSIVGRAVTVTILAVAVIAIVGTLLGQPLLLGFVESGSMEPSISTGDGFVTIPAAIAGPVEPGDVVVYDAERLNGGGLVVHRVVGETDRGYVTKGTANPFTDQSVGEPPVKEAQIVAVAPQIGGGPVVIPHLGDAVDLVGAPIGVLQGWLGGLFGSDASGGAQGLAYTVFALCVLGYVLETWRERRGRASERETGREVGLNVRLVLAGFTLLLVVAATLAMVGPAGDHRYGVVSADFDSPGPRVVPAGEQETATHPIGNAGVVPVVVYLEPASDGVDVEAGAATLGPGEVHNATVALSAPPETGFYRRYVTQHRYLAVLPRPVIDGLYAIHPWLPIVVIDALLAGSYYLLCSLVVGAGRVRDRTRDRPRRNRLLRVARRIYE